VPFHFYDFYKVARPDQILLREKDGTSGNDSRRKITGNWEVGGKSQMIILSLFTNCVEESNRKKSKKKNLI